MLNVVSMIYIIILSYNICRNPSHVGSSSICSRIQKHVCCRALRRDVLPNNQVKRENLINMLSLAFWNQLKPTDLLCIIIHRVRVNGRRELSWRDKTMNTELLFGHLRDPATDSWTGNDCNHNIVCMNPSYYNSNTAIKRARTSRR